MLYVQCSMLSNTGFLTLAYAVPRSYTMFVMKKIKNYIIEVFLEKQF